MSESTLRERIARALGAHQDDRGRDAPVFAGMMVLIHILTGGGGSHE